MDQFHGKQQQIAQLFFFAETFLLYMQKLTILFLHLNQINLAVIFNGAFVFQLNGIIFFAGTKESSILLT